MDETLHAAVAAIEGDERLDPASESLERLAGALSGGAAGPVLRGDWLGHALHPLLTDVPIGCWTSAGVLDLVGGKASRRAAQRLVGLGVVAAVPTMASGLSELPALRDPQQRRVAAVHAVGNAVVGLLYLRSWRARRHGHHLRGVGLGLAGGVVAAATGYLGGHLAYARRAGTGARGAFTEGVVGMPEADGLVDLTQASAIIGVPEPQVLAMVDEGMLDAAVRAPELRFRDADVRAVRLLGA